MEPALLELLFRGSCCLIELLAASANVGAGVAGARAKRKLRERRQAKQQGATPPPVGNEVGCFLALLMLGGILTILAVMKWLT